LQFEEYFVGVFVVLFEEGFLEQNVPETLEFVGVDVVECFGVAVGHDVLLALLLEVTLELLDLGVPRALSQTHDGVDRHLVQVHTTHFEVAEVHELAAEGHRLLLHSPLQEDKFVLLQDAQHGGVVDSPPHLLDVFLLHVGHRGQHPHVDQLLALQVVEFEVAIQVNQRHEVGLIVESYFVGFFPDDPLGVDSDVR